MTHRKVIEQTKNFIGSYDQTFERNNCTYHPNGKTRGEAFKLLDEFSSMKLEPFSSFPFKGFGDFILPVETLFTPKEFKQMIALNAWALEGLGFEGKCEFELEPFFIDKLCKLIGYDHSFPLSLGINRTKYNENSIDQIGFIDGMLYTLGFEGDYYDFEMKFTLYYGVAPKLSNNNILIEPYDEFKTFSFRAFFEIDHGLRIRFYVQDDLIMQEIKDFEVEFHDLIKDNREQLFCWPILTFEDAMRYINEYLIFYNFEISFDFFEHNFFITTYGEEDFEE